MVCYTLTMVSSFELATNSSGEIPVFPRDFESTRISVTDFLQKPSSARYRLDLFEQQIIAQIAKSSVNKPYEKFGLTVNHNRQIYRSKRLFYGDEDGVSSVVATGNSSSTKIALSIYHQHFSSPLFSYGDVSTCLKPVYKGNMLVAVVQGGMVSFLAKPWGFKDLAFQESSGIASEYWNMLFKLGVNMEHPSEDDLIAIAEYFRSKGLYFYFGKTEDRVLQSPS